VARDVGFRYVTRDELLTGADIISLHAPATPGTRHLLNREAFSHMKRGVIIINTARGPLIDTPALIEAVQNGIVAGAGLDVLEGELFLEFSNKKQLLASDIVDGRSRQVLALDVLAGMPTVLITDHNAFNTAEAIERIRHRTVANICGYAAGRPVNLVHPVR
jgi:D-lactate dehydrogenase